MARCAFAAGFLMAGKIRVLFDFGATGRHHSLYDEFLQAPPENVEYLTKSIAASKTSLRRKAFHFLKRTAGRLIDFDRLARRANRAGAPQCDIVHFANNLDSVRQPFVSDFEHALSFLPGYPQTGKEPWLAKARQRTTGIIESDNCKAMLPWTYEGAKSLWQAFPSKEVEEKTHVLPLAMRIPKDHAPIAHDNFRVLFLGTSNLSGPSNFYYRGGRRLLRVFSRFAQGKGDVELVMTGQVPDCESALLSRTPHARAAGLVSKDELERIFRTSDVLLYPSYMTPGLAFLEAMRYHLPIVTTDAWANREIISHKKNGLVSEFTQFDTHGAFNILRSEQDYTAFERNGIDASLEGSLVESLEALYADRKLARKMGDCGFSLVNSGKFSIKERNKKLGKIYERALE